jgi:hypothetical protein
MDQEKHVLKSIKFFKRNLLVNVIDLRSPHKYKDCFINVNNLCEDCRLEVLKANLRPSFGTAELLVNY